MLLEVKNINVNYEKVEALKGISLEVDQGMIVTLIGANGAGKTTLLRTISGLKRPLSGEIWFNGLRIDRMPPTDIVKLGVTHVPEGRRLFPYMTTWENIKAGAFVRKDTREIFKDFEQGYRRFPILRERSRQRAGSLSGGEQQMVAIQRGLMSKPRLLLLDEPTMGLAPMVRRTIVGSIKQLRELGIGVILVEQNARLALSIADKAYVLETGKIVLEDDAHKLLNSEYVKKAYLGG